VGCAQPHKDEAKNQQFSVNSLKSNSYIRLKNNQFKAESLFMAIVGRFLVVVNRVIHR
jgi:hypothetical protein